MIERIIHFSIKNKFIVGLFVVALIGWGSYSLVRLPIDAIPDITNNQVQVISIAPSLAVQEVESFITAPIEVAVASIPDIIELRSISRLGLSVITIVFKDNVDVYWARQQLNERLKEAEEDIPAGLAKIELAPISSGLGEIFQYKLTVDKGLEKKYDPMELRTLQDWVVRREMLGTPGVADINSYGGYVKQYEIAVNPERLRGMNLSLTDIFDALGKNNENTGSAYIDKNPNAYFIRGIGLVKTLDDIEKIVVKTNNSGIPILVRDIAEVRYGSATRYGAFVVDTTEAVGGVVMMLKGANAHQVIEDVESRIATIQKSLPNGVKIEPFLNRSELVSRAIGTVSRNLLEGALIVIFILVLMLGNVRAGLIVASVIPLSMLFAISLMNFFGVSGNLMSLGAIDFGLIVDGAVIIVESVVHRIFMNGVQIPLSEIADIDYTRGTQMIRSENTFLVGYIIFDKIEGKAEVDVVNEANKILKQKMDSGHLTLSNGVTYKFAGNYEHEMRATKRLAIVVPLSLLVILLLLYFQFRTVTASLIHFSGVFVAFAGGFIMLWLYGQDWFLNFSIAGINLRDLFQMHLINLSVAVWVGFIALFGIATNDGVIMGTYIHQTFEQRHPGTVHDVREAVIAAGLKRVRPAMMTTAVAVIALLPVLTSTGKGSDIMVPMAIPTFGGMIIQVMTIFVVPMFQSMWREYAVTHQKLEIEQSNTDQDENFNI